VIAASVQACFDAMSDFETYPDWQSSVKECTVLERGDDFALVETITDIRVRDVRYRIAVDPGRFVPGPLARLVAREGTRRAVDDLRARVEPGA
jgi:hypothetical protein